MVERFLLERKHDDCLEEHCCGASAAQLVHASTGRRCNTLGTAKRKKAAHSPLSFLVCSGGGKVDKKRQLYMREASASPHRFRMCRRIHSTYTCMLILSFPRTLCTLDDAPPPPSRIFPLELVQGFIRATLLHHNKYNSTTALHSILIYYNIAESSMLVLYVCSWRLWHRKPRLARVESDF